MKRGVILLTNSETKEAFNLIKDTQVDTPLHVKLSSIQESFEEEIKIQVSDDELEILLDELGPPEENESEIKRNLRERLRYFFSYLRNK